jgi:hypothetical protein
MDFEDMFSNFNTLPTVNFAVTDEEVSDQLWGDKPTRRTLFREFNKAAGPDMFDIAPSYNKFDRMNSSRANFPRGPTQSNFSPSKKQRKKKRGVTLNNQSSKFRATGKSKEYRIRGSLFSSKNNIQISKNINYQSVQAHNLRSLKELSKKNRLNKSKDHVRHSSKGNLIHNKHIKNRHVYRSMNFKNIYSLKTDSDNIENSTNH